MEAGGSDVANIIHGLEKIAEFAVLLGMDFRLLPVLLAKFGNPTSGIQIFVNTLLDARKSRAEKRSAPSRAAGDFCSKLDTLRGKNPESHKKYRGGNVLLANVATGSDTTITSPSAILFHLIRQRDSYLKLRREIIDAVERGEVDDPITLDQAQKLPYLQLAIKEGLRIHAATGLPMWRVVPRGGATIADTYFPEGAVVGINSWVAHHNQNVFGADAATFRPERWDPTTTPEQQLNRMERYFIPFGAGTRTYIGKNISTMEITKLIPELVKRYDFELCSEELKYVNHWFVKPHDLNARITRV
ncbi:hypothetical protein NW755_007875 [Fusarium falciforme]|uniref:Pisatin demethylase n=1 Tax=Fusarium falciforme TaxID=195108 RepID=A0A9W8R3G5_9HYPO|nr:hypothetical protein NW755_007875 [Fusarium falciforme]